MGEGFLGHGLLVRRDGQAAFGDMEGALGGAAVGVGWNYTINRLLTWRM